MPAKNATCKLLGQGQHDTITSALELPHLNNPAGQQGSTAEHKVQGQTPNGAGPNPDPKTRAWKQHTCQQSC
jgi:hypothetical protein